VGFFAPRIAPALHDDIARLASRPLRAAEICRTVGKTAEQQGYRRPSYEQVRLLVSAARRRPRRVSTAAVLFDIALRVEHPHAFIQHVSGTQTRFASK